jgi:(2Fe-2S) ferredoxin
VRASKITVIFEPANTLANHNRGPFNMAAFEHHIFVCGNQRPPGGRCCCDPTGSKSLQKCFKAELDKHGLKSTVRANTAGCLDQCELGPTIVIYPQGIWYGRVTEADVPRIVERTIVHGELLPDLLIPNELLNTKQGWPTK